MNSNWKQSLEEGSIILNARKEEAKKKQQEEYLAKISHSIEIINDNLNVLSEESAVINECCEKLEEISEPFLAKTNFFNIITTLVNKPDLSEEIRLNLLLSLFNVAKLKGEYLIRIIRDHNALGIYMNCISSNSVLFLVGCDFFMHCFNNKKTVPYLIQNGFFGSFILRFDLMTKSLNANNDELLKKCIVKASDVFLDFTRKMDRNTLEPGKEKMHILVMDLYNCPIRIELAEVVAHIVVALGDKFGYSDILETEMYQTTVAILFTPEMYGGLKYTIALLNNTLCQSYFDLPIEIPFEGIQKLIIDISSNAEDNKFLSDRELIRNVFYFLITASCSGYDYHVYFLNPCVYNAIISIIENSTYSIRMLGLEFLWTLMAFSSIEQNVFIVDSSSDLLLEIFEGDDEELTERIINDIVKIFIDNIGKCKHEPLLEFISKLKTATEELAESDVPSLKELSESFEDCINAAVPELNIKD